MPLCMCFARTHTRARMQWQALIHAWTKFARAPVPLACPQTTSRCRPPALSCMQAARLHPRPGVFRRHPVQFEQVCISSLMAAQQRVDMHVCPHAREQQLLHMMWHCGLMKEGFPACMHVRMYARRRGAAGWAGRGRCRRHTGAHAVWRRAGRDGWLGDRLVVGRVAQQQSNACCRARHYCSISKRRCDSPEQSKKVVDHP